VSNHRNVAVLSFHQPIGSRAGTFIQPDVAELLLQRMAAERISSKVIRMLPPDSVFPAFRPPVSRAKFIPEVLPPVEVANCIFVRPKTDLRPSIVGVREGWDWNHEPISA